MAIIPGTFQTYSAVGLREDLTDVIYNISPVDTPMMTRIGRAKAEATYHEWQTDSLAAAADNAQIQGDDVSSFDTVNPTVRLGNYTQISRKTAIIAATEEAVRKAGRTNEMAYQVAKKGKELKRDVERAIVGVNQAKLVGNSTTAARSASVLSWIGTNSDIGATGANPATLDGNATRTDGTQRAFTETILKNVLGQIWTNSGEEPDMVLLPQTQKVIASTFSGNLQRMINAEDRELVTTIDIYRYDFGQVQLVPERFMRSRDALVVNTDLWAIAYLRPIHLEDLAKTGDATKKLIIGEWSLESRNEAGSGIV